MAKVIQSKIPPKGYRRTFEIELIKINPADSGEARDEILDWCREQLSSTVYWDMVGFAPKHNKFKTAPSRKKNFDDDEQVLKLWFMKERDAALCKITWFWRS